LFFASKYRGRGSRRGGEWSETEIKTKRKKTGEPREKPKRKEEKPPPATTTTPPPTAP
jgi:hypothetical protein